MVPDEDADDHERWTDRGPKIASELSAWDLTRKLRLVASQIRLIDERVAAAANAVVALHTAAERNYRHYDNPLDGIETLVLDRAELLASRWLSTGQASADQWGVAFGLRGMPPITGYHTDVISCRQ